MSLYLEIRKDVKQDISTYQPGHLESLDNRVVKLNQSISNLFRVNRTSYACMYPKEKSYYNNFMGKRAKNRLVFPYNNFKG